jgi:CyaY protein
MNPREQEDLAFDQLAESQLKKLERALLSYDPDELEAEKAGDVLNITLFAGQPSQSKIVINRHRAARQIWMSAQRRAWHFDSVRSGGDSCTWRTQAHGRDEELVATLQEVLSALLKRPIQIKL